MDHGNERDTPPGRPAGPGALPDDPVADPLAGRVPLAVVVVDRDGLVSHWSRGARRLFGLPREEAIGRPASDLLPVSGVVPDVGAEDDDTDALHSYGRVRRRRRPRTRPGVLARRAALLPRRRAAPG
ncbi:hypothetical protein TPA0906_12770 [Streptomyces olivaceus]|nr:hypothetical protein TPA0906_12770 [Streptomyces olivaceus]